MSLGCPTQECCVSLRNQTLGRLRGAAPLTCEHLVSMFVVFHYQMQRNRQVSFLLIIYVLLELPLRYLKYAQL